MPQDSDILSMTFVFSELLNNRILGVINHSKYSNVISKILVYLFPLMVLATSIPVYSIIVRYNLLQNRVCSKGILLL